MSRSSRTKASASGAAKANELFYAERILQVRGQGASREYFIKWKSYPHPKDMTWEPVGHLLDGIQGWLEDFDRAHAAEQALALEKKRNQELTIAVGLNRSGKRKGITDTDPTTSSAPAPSDADNVDKAAELKKFKLGREKVKESENAKEDKPAEKVEPPQNQGQLAVPIKQEIVEDAPPEEPVSEDPFLQDVGYPSLLLNEKDEKTAALEAKIKTMELEKKKLENKLFSHEAELDENTLTINKLTRELSSAQSGSQSVKDKHDKLKAELMDVQAKCSSLDLETERHMEQLAEMTLTLADTLEKLEDVRREKDQLDGKCSSLFTQNGALELKAKNMEQENHRLGEELGKKSEEVLKAHVRDNELISRLSEKEATIKQLQKAVIELEESAQYVKQLEASETALETQVKEVQLKRRQQMVKDYAKTAAMRQERDKLKKNCLEMLEGLMEVLLEQQLDNGRAMDHDSKCRYKVALRNLVVKYTGLKYEHEELINIRLRLEHQNQMFRDEKIGGTQGDGASA